MSESELYETETMAELCARQGRLGEAIDIYRRLEGMAAPPDVRARWRARLGALEERWQPTRVVEAAPVEIPLPPAPGVSVLASDDQVTVAWALPPDADLPEPALEVLVIQRTRTGIETTKRAVPLPAHSGRVGFAAVGIHSALAAVGSGAEGRFVPVARSARR